MQILQELPEKTDRGPKKHINWFDINFLAPTQKHSILGPQKKAYVPRSKRVPHKLLRGDFGSKRVSQTAHFRPQKVWFLGFFPCL